MEGGIEQPYASIMRLRGKRLPLGHAGPAEVVVSDADPCSGGEGRAGRGCIQVLSSEGEEPVQLAAPEDSVLSAAQGHVRDAQRAPPQERASIVPGSRRRESRDAFFDSDDSELSPLENFTFLSDLARRGGEDAKRAEFIMNQFGKASGEDLADGHQRHHGHGGGGSDDEEDRGAARRTSGKHASYGRGGQPQGKRRRGGAPGRMYR